MKRYIPQFHKGGFPELYVVLDTHDRCTVGEPKPYHDANDEAEARNNTDAWKRIAALVLPPIKA